MAKHVIKRFTLLGSDTILVFLYETVWQYFDRDLSNGCIECPGGVKNSNFQPIAIARFISEMIRDIAIVIIEY